MQGLSSLARGTASIARTAPKVTKVARQSNKIPTTSRAPHTAPHKSTHESPSIQIVKPAKGWGESIGGGLTTIGTGVAYGGAYYVVRNDLKSLFSSFVNGFSTLGHGGEEALEALKDELGLLMEGAKNIGTTAFGQAGGNLMTILVVGGTVYIVYEVYRFMT